MKAAVFDQGGGPEVFRIRDVPDPVPGEGELLVRVEAISLEGGDLLGRQQGQALFPAVPGYAAAGEIIQVGGGVSGFDVGQKVATFAFSGSHAEFRVVPAWTSFLVPDGLDIGVAAAIPCGPGTAALALQLGRLQAGDTVLVTGAAGGVGIAVVQLASRAGARVIGTGTSAETLERLRDYGLSDAIVVGQAPTSEKVRHLLGGGVDLVVDTVGGPARTDALIALADGGRAVLVGVSAGFSTTIDAGDVLSRRLTVTGCFLGPIIADTSTRASIDALLHMAAVGEIEVPIDSRYPFAQVAAAHRRAEERGRIGRVIVSV